MLSKSFSPVIRLLTITSLTCLVASCGSGDGPAKVNDGTDSDPTSAEYTLVWSDEFNADGAPDVRNWVIEEGGGGWGNDEWQTYTDNAENVRVEGGNLVINAQCSTPAVDCKTAGDNGTITSARLTTNDKVEVKYGSIQARIKMPDGKGTWPAFWMLGSEFPDTPWPQAGEIDIVEIHQFYSNLETTHTAMHWCDDSVGGTPCQTDPGRTFNEQFLELDFNVSDDFHVYEASWDEDRVVGKIDGIAYFTLPIDQANRSEFLNKFFMILNIAVGGDLGGPPDNSTTWPQEMLVDWVRVYQQNEPDQIELVPDEDASPFTYDNYVRIVNSVEYGGDSVVSTIQRALSEDDELFSDVTAPAVTPLTGNTIVEFDYETGNTFFSGGAFLFKIKDVSHYEKLIFSIDTSNMPDLAEITMEVNDARYTGADNTGIVRIPLSTYTPTAVTGNWRTYEVPLTDFVGVNLDNLTSWGFWNPVDASNELVAGKLYLDDIRFVDVPCTANGVVSFSADTIKGNSGSAQISVTDSCLANKNEKVVVVVSNGTEEVGVSIPILASGLGLGTVNFGSATKDSTDTIALTEGAVLTASYIDANGGNQTDTATIDTPPLAIYSETRVDNILPYSDVLDDDVTTDDASTVVTAFEGAVSLQAVFTDPADDEAGYSFVFEGAGSDLLSNDSFEVPDATSGLVSCNGNPGNSITDWECYNFPFVFNNAFLTEPSPMAREGTQVIGAVGSDAIVQQSVTVVPGDAVTASAYAMNWDTRPLSGIAIMQLNFLDASDAVIETIEVLGSADGSQTYTLSSQNGDSVDDWTLMEVSGTAPAGSAKAQIFLLHVIGGGTSDSTVFYDDATISVASSATVVPDLSFFETLSFAVNSTDASASTLMDMEVRLTDGNGASSSVYLSAYSAADNGDWDIYEIPLSAFSGIDMTDIASLDFFNPTSDVVGDLSYPTHIPATLYFDDVHFTVAEPTAVKSGALVDSAIQGVFFKTLTRSGLTNVDGRFWYEEGETVEFYVGGETGIFLGAVTGAPLVTPVELTGSGDPVDQTATNMLLFLQSIDDDQDHSNGILLTAYTRTQAAGETLDFTSGTFTADVATVITNIGEITTPVVEMDALDNFYLTYVSFNGTDTFSWSFPAPYAVVPSNELGLYSETYATPLYPEISITEEIDTVAGCNTNAVDNADAVYTPYEGTVSTKVDFASTPNACNGFFYNFGSGSAGSTSSYSSDFESYTTGDVEDFVIGNIVNAGAGWFPGTFGAPGDYNNGYSAIVNEGGVDQGTKQLSIFSDYNPWSPFTGGPGITIQAFVTRDVGQVGAGDDGVTYRFSFDAKLPDSGNGVQEDVSSQAEAFVKVLKSSDGSYNELANNTFDSDENLSLTWGRGYIDLEIDAGMVGELVQIGFNSTATDYAPSAVYYDNLDFSPLLVDLTEFETFKFAVDVSQTTPALADLEIKIEDGTGATASVFLSAYTSTSGGVANWEVYTIPLSDFTGVDQAAIRTLGFYNASSIVTGGPLVLPALLDGSVYFDDLHFIKAP